MPDRAGDVDRPEVDAVGEGPLADAGDTVRKSYHPEGGAMREGIIPDLHQVPVFREGQLPQREAAEEGPAANPPDGCGYVDGSQRLAPLEGRCGDGFYGVGDYRGLAPEDERFAILREAAVGFGLICRIVFGYVYGCLSLGI